MRIAGQSVEFHNGELRIRGDREHYRIRAWPGPQAFKSEDGKEWKRAADLPAETDRNQAG